MTETRDAMTSVETINQRIMYIYMNGQTCFIPAVQSLLAGFVLQQHMFDICDKWR